MGCRIVRADPQRRTPCYASHDVMRFVRPKGRRNGGNAMLVRGAAGSIAVILLTGSAALAADAPPGDASAPSQEGQGVTQAQAAPVVSAPDVSLGGPVVLPVLSALPADYFATTPPLLGESPGVRARPG